MIIWYSLIIFDVNITNYIHGRIYNNYKMRDYQNHSIPRKQTNFFIKYHADKVFIWRIDTHVISCF